MKQLWLDNKLTDVIPVQKRASRPKSEVISELDFATVVKVYDELKINALNCQSKQSRIARASKAETQEVGQVREGAQHRSVIYRLV